MCETATFSAVVWQEGKMQVAWCPELDIASQGKDIEQALKNLREAVELYLEDEDAKMPGGKSPMVTTLSVEMHAKDSSGVRS
ncbi:MAG: type II toxin-antitoxin system HicB family antitoxin [Candidatus Bathyarchaeia archaeon]